MRKINKRHFRWVLVVLVIILLSGGLAVGIHLHNIHRAQQASGTIPTSKKNTNSISESSKNQNGTTNQTSSSTLSTSTNKKLPTSLPSNSPVLQVPFGNFVSNHTPGQSGAPNTEQSVCNTTPGATCDIQFTNTSGVVKDLGVELVDSSGVAYWSWNVSGATLASGSWKITAVVKLNGQTQTATDPRPLEVQ